MCCHTPPYQATGCPGNIRFAMTGEAHHRPLGHANGKWMGQDSNLRCFFVTDLQSAALATRHTHPWGDQGESVSAPLRSAQSRCPPDILRPHKQSHISAKRTASALLPLSYNHSSSCGVLWSGGPRPAPTEAKRRLRTHHLRLERPAS